MLEFGHLVYNILTRLNKTNISTQELQNILFLIDWRAALSEKPSISALEWEIGTEGPYSKDLQDKIKSNTKILLIEHLDQIRLNPQRPQLADIPTGWQRQIINFTLSKIKNINKNDFDNLIKSLFPMKLEKFIPINLASIAKDYLNSGVSIQKINLD